MDYEVYNSKIQAIDTQISEVRSRISSIEAEIDETQSAAESTNNLRKELDDFVDRRKSSLGKPSMGNTLKSYMGFIKKATSLLSGNEYLKASGQINEISRMINSDLKHYDEDLKYYKEKLKRLIEQKQTVTADYKASLLSSDEEVL